MGDPPLALLASPGSPRSLPLNPEVWEIPPGVARVIRLPSVPQIDSRSTPDRSQVGPRSSPDRSHTEPRPIPSRLQINPRSNPDRRSNRPQIDHIFTTTCHKSIPDWSQIDPRSAPDPPQTEPRSAPNRTQTDPRSLPRNPEVWEIPPGVARVTRLPPVTAPEP